MKINQKQIIYLPSFTKQEDLNDQIARALWYLMYIQPKSIYFPVDSKLRSQFQIPCDLDPCINQIYQKYSHQIHLLNVEDHSSIISHINKSDIVMYWNKDKRSSTFLHSDLPLQNKQVWQVDHVREPKEGLNYISAGFENILKKNRYLNENRRKMKKIIQTFKGAKKAYVFGTGNSVEQYREFDFSDGVSIICNSIVVNEELIDYVNPKILVFGDQIFHFGCSLYAAKFRESLTKIMDKYDLYLIIPFLYYPLFVHYFPQFRNKTIGIPVEPHAKINLDLSRSFYVKVTRNIFTLLLLPVASSLAEHVELIGFDGKKATEKEYYWSHSRKTQINEYMDNIQKVHPSFFHGRYEEYYDNHRKILEDYLQLGEKFGHTYKSLTKSHVLSIRQRYKFETLLQNYEEYPLVSIILIWDEHLHTLYKKCLDSILGQEYKNFEILLISNDFNRGDGIKQLINCYQDKRIRIVNYDKSDLISIKNFSISESCGEFITFIKLSSLMLPGSLKYRMESLIDNDFDAAFCPVKIINNDFQELGYIQHSNDFKGFIQALTLNLPLESVIIRKKLLIDHGGFDAQYQPYEDWDLFQRLARSGVFFHNIRHTSVAQVLGSFYNGNYIYQIPVGTIPGKLLDLIYNKDKRVKNSIPDYEKGLAFAQIKNIKNRALFMYIINKLLINPFATEEILSDWYKISYQFNNELTEEDLYEYLNKGIVNNYHQSAIKWCRDNFEQKSRLLDGIKRLQKHPNCHWSFFRSTELMKKFFVYDFDLSYKKDQEKELIEKYFNSYSWKIGQFVINFIKRYLLWMPYLKRRYLNQKLTNSFKEQCV